MFELNENLKIEKEIFQETVIYTIDDFYKNPKEVENYLKVLGAWDLLEQ